MKTISLEKHDSYLEKEEKRYPKSFLLMRHNTIVAQGQNGVEIAMFIDREESVSVLRFLGNTWDEQNIREVIDYDIWIKKDNAWMLVDKVKHLVDIDELRDIYVAVSVSGDSPSGGFDVYIYHNDSIEKIIRGVCEYKDGHDLKVYYIQKGPDAYYHYIYKRGKSILLLKSPNRYSHTQYKHEKYHIDYSKKNIDAEKYVKIWFHNSSSKNFYITEKFAKDYADYYYMEESPFPDDTMVNFCAVFNKEKKTEIMFMQEYGCEYGYAVYGVTYDQLKTACDIKPSREKVYIEKERLYEYLGEEDSLKYVLTHIYNMMGKSIDFTTIPFIENYMPDPQNHAIICSVLENVVPSYDLKQKKKEIYDQLIAERVLIPNWKTEYDLYKIVKKKYEDCIFQYRDHVLKGQSIDVFIPSLKVGIEYQGLQHYEPVSIFGGKEGFERTKERDKRKQEICCENGIKLIYWKYDEPVNSVQLAKKMAGM